MKKVLLLGDSCIDEYIFGVCERLNPEAPTPILKFLEKESRAGMAANVNLNLQAFGLKVDFLTNSETITKTRFIEKRFHHHLLRVDNDVDLVPLDIDNVLKMIHDNHYHAIVISDYNKGLITDELIESIRSTVKIKMPVFVDTKKTDLSKFEGCIVKINEYEYSQLQSECSDLIVTLGSRGARFRDRIYPAPVVEVFDVCGAGDTFLSALCFTYLKTHNVPYSITVANSAAAVAVKHTGSHVLTKKEIAGIINLKHD